MQVEIRVILADNQELLRDGFKVLLRKHKHIRLVAEASNGKELCILVEKHHPHVVITDIMMPLMNGIEAARIIKKKHPAVAIIGFSMLEEVDQIVDMIDAGADGYVLKNVSKKEIIEAVTTVSRGKSYYCSTTSKKLLNFIHPKIQNGSKSEKASFTNRELEVMKCIATGLTNKEIGKALGISSRTVENYRETIQYKIGARNVAGIVLYAIQNGIYGSDQ